MKFILRDRYVHLVAQFAASNVLIAFDYDGTLAPIAPTPASARMRPRTRRLLTRLAQHYPCVVISGRPLADLVKRLRHIPVWHVVGDHGSEPWATHDGAERVSEWVTELRSRLPRASGLVIEQKRHSVTVHYRHVRDRRRVLAALHEAVRGLSDVRAIDGTEALNLLPADGPNKGQALQQARRVFACDTAIYVGDDDTDEDAFASDGAQRLLSIRIGTRRRSAAQFRLSRQAEIDTLLELLLRLRATSGDPSAAGTLGPRRRKYSRAESTDRARTGAT